MPRSARKAVVGAIGYVPKDSRMHSLSAEHKKSLCFSSFVTSCFEISSILFQIPITWLAREVDEFFVEKKAPHHVDLPTLNKGSTLPLSPLGINGPHSLDRGTQGEPSGCSPKPNISGQLFQWVSFE